MAEQTLTVTMDQLNDLIANAIRVAKEPSPEEAQKQAEEKARIAQLRQDSIDMAKLEIEQRELGYKNCSHQKENGKPSVGGQIHSDGLYHPFCLRCQKPFEPFKVAGESAAQGIS